MDHTKLAFPFFQMDIGEGELRFPPFPFPLPPSSVRPSLDGNSVSAGRFGKPSDTESPQLTPPAVHLAPVGWMSRGNMSASPLRPSASVRPRPGNDDN